MKKAGKILGLLAMLGLTLGFAVLPVKANENTDEVAVTELNQVMTILVDCDAKEFPKRGAASVVSYDAGSPVWVVGETQDGWYMVSYQDKKGYIPKDYIAELQVEVADKGVVNLTDAGLDAEMEAVEAENKMLVEEVERQRGETKRSHIWTIVIVLLVIGIFATGIISTIKSGKGTEEQNDDKAGEAEGKAEKSIEVIDLDLEEEENHETDHSDPLL